MSDQINSDPRKGVGYSMAEAISLLLIIGVALSAAVLATGLVYLMIRGRTGYHEALAPDLIVAREGAVVFPTTIGGVLEGAVALKPFAVIELGALLLIATPVFRVGASIILFLMERDYLYVVITLAVFSVLLASIFLIR